ncbi:MAG: DUF6414 family protein [Bacillota bacterium]|nr:DUF6414 family protein [Bacillota bacterium]
MEKNTGKENKICKVVYFDEDSVTDYIQIIEGGKLEKTTQLLDENDNNGETGVEAGITVGTKGFFKGLLGLEAKAEINSELKASFNTNRMVKNILQNTILTDFINLIDERNSSINKFKGYKLTVPKDSMTYMALVAPYLSMISNSDISAGEFNIAIDKLDSTLKNAKGYYEFVGVLDSETVIFRFNIDSFKNNYKVTDLMKMNIIIYAIKVGVSSLSKLNFNNEFEIDNILDNPDYGDKKSNRDVHNESEYDVYDVLLAGVEFE